MFKFLVCKKCVLKYDLHILGIKYFVDYTCILVFCIFFLFYSVRLLFEIICYFLFIFLIFILYTYIRTYIYLYYYYYICPIYSCACDVYFFNFTVFTVFM